MIKLSVAALLLASTSAFTAASQTHSVHDGADYSEIQTIRELRELKSEVRALRRDIARLEQSFAAGQWRSDETSLHDKKWGCFMQDLKAGGLVATGSTEAEAKGRLLERCTERNGSCFARNMECSAAQ